MRRALPLLLAAALAAAADVLVVHDHVPQFDRFGSDARLLQVVAALADEGHAVTVAARSSVWAQGRYEAAVVARGAKLVHPAPPCSEAFLEHALPGADVALLTTWFWGAGRRPVLDAYVDAVRLHSPGTAVVALSDDLHGVRASDAGLARAEARMLAAADAVVTVAEHVAAEQAQTVPAFVVRFAGERPAGADPPAGPEGRTGAVFVGNGANEANAEALAWALARLPADAELHVVGEGHHHHHHHDPRVVAHGHLSEPALADLLARRRVMFAPTLRAGVGVQTKAVLAQAHGLPVADVAEMEGPALARLLDPAEGDFWRAARREPPSLADVRADVRALMAGVELEAGAAGRGRAYRAAVVCAEELVTPEGAPAAALALATTLALLQPWRSARRLFAVAAAACAASAAVLARASGAEAFTVLGGEAHDRPLTVVVHSQTLGEAEGQIAGSEVTTFCLARALARRADVARVERVSGGAFPEGLGSVDVAIVEGWAPGVPDFVEALRREHRGARLFLWNLDTWGLDALLSLGFDGFFTNVASAEHVARLEALAPTARVLLAADPEVFAPLPDGPDARYAHPVVFLGHNSRAKPLLHPMLRAARPALYGWDWGDEPEFADLWRGALPFGDIAALYSSAGLVLGLTDEEQAALGAVNNRVFEALASGACIAVHEFPGLRDVFGEGNGVLYWSTIAELEALLRAPVDRAACARGRALVAAEHTYDQRAEAMLAHYRAVRRRGPRADLPRFGHGALPDEMDSLFGALERSSLLMLDRANAWYVGGDEGRLVRMSSGSEEWVAHVADRPGLVLVRGYSHGPPTAWGVSVSGGGEVVGARFATEATRFSVRWTTVDVLVRVREPGQRLRVAFPDTEPVWSPQLGSVAYTELVDDCMRPEAWLASSPGVLRMGGALRSMGAPGLVLWGSWGPGGDAGGDPQGHEWIEVPGTAVAVEGGLWQRPLPLEGRTRIAFSSQAPLTRCVVGSGVGGSSTGVGGSSTGVGGSAEL